MDNKSPRPGSLKNTIFTDTSAMYRATLRDRKQSRHGPISACWIPDANVKPEHLLALVNDAENAPGSTTIKEDRRTKVMRTRLLGYDVIIKQYRLTTFSERIKYLFRCSPARRFWAASRTMQAFCIPTPQPLGLIEIHCGGVPVQSRIISACLNESLTVRQWFETGAGALPADQKEMFADQLSTLLQSLYACGLYHRDTKCENILITHPYDPAQRTLHWIDLECVQCKAHPSRHDIIRNLVQLNGSICHVVSKEDRMIFLSRMARIYPWVIREDAVLRIQNWTYRRLEKEQYETH